MLHCIEVRIKEGHYGRYAGDYGDYGDYPIGIDDLLLTLYDHSEEHRPIIADGLGIPTSLDNPDETTIEELNYWLTCPHGAMKIFERAIADRCTHSLAALARQPPFQEAASRALVALARIPGRNRHAELKRAVAIKVLVSADSPISQSHRAFLLHELAITSPRAIMDAGGLEPLKPIARNGSHDARRALALMGEEEFMSGTVHVSVKTLTHQNFMVEVHLSDSVEILKCHFFGKTGIPQEQQRIVYEGNQLGDNKILSDYNITNGSLLYLVLRLRGGCIASPVPALFCSPTSGPGLHILTGSIASAAATDACAVITLLGGSLDHAPQILPDALLNRAQCATLIRLLDECAAACPADRVTDDLKLSLTTAELVAHIGVPAIERLSTAFGVPFDTIKLRRVSAVGKCVAFHCDYSKRTMQVVLNGDDEYDGGRLTFATADGFVQPARPRGSATVHVNSIVHGVSTLRRGVRYGLFLCDTVGANPPRLTYLVEPARKQFAFFKRAVELLGQATDEELKAVVREYAELLTSSATANADVGADANTNVAPRFAVELAWRTHLLHPRCYAVACESRSLPLVDHTPLAADAYPPLEDMDEASGAARAVERGLDGPSPIGWLGLDLVAAMRRQQPFMRDMLDAQVAYTNDGALVQAVGDYCIFLDRIHHVHHTELVPTPLVDLIWHTHMLYPRRYGRETRQLAGCFVDHGID